jgi:hypothetical protein
MRRLVRTVAVAIALATPHVVMAQEKVPNLDNRGWWWPVGAMIGIVALITAGCFLNPKRSHDN